MYAQNSHWKYYTASPYDALPSIESELTLSEQSPSSIGVSFYDFGQSSSYGFTFTPNQTFNLEQRAFLAGSTFFNYVPGEIRNKIYGYLVKDVVVEVAGSLRNMCDNTKTISLFVYRAVKNRSEKRGPIAGRKHNRCERSHSNFMCISRQFFTEVRDILHRDMTVMFLRRWDFLNACGIQSLYLDSIPSTDKGDLLLFPQSSAIFGKIRRLYLNLCQSGDFGGKIHTVEAERVTRLLMKMVAQNLPEIRTLALCLNAKSRISLVEGVFLPEPYFVDALLAIKQIKTIHLIPGAGWRGTGPRQKTFQHNLAAFELLMERHYTGVHVIEPQDIAGGTRWERLAKIGRKILTNRDFETSKRLGSYTHAMNLMSYKVYAIEHGIRR